MAKGGKIQKIPVEKITLVYVCPICNASFRQALSSIVESGTAVCPDCDVDCLLDEEAEIQ